MINILKNLLGLKLNFLYNGIILSGLLIIAGAYYYVTKKISDLEETNIISKTTILRLNSNNEKLFTSISLFKEEQIIFNTKLEALSILEEESDLERKRLYELFTNHNFKNLLSKKPGLMENKINSASSAFSKLLNNTTARIDTNTHSKSSNVKGSPPPNVRTH